jgi:hypothetical protein
MLYQVLVKVKIEYIFIFMPQFSFYQVLVKVKIEYIFNFIAHQLMHLYNVEQGLLSVNYLIYQVQGLSVYQIFHNSMHQKVNILHQQL